MGSYASTLAHAELGDVQLTPPIDMYIGNQCLFACLLVQDPGQNSVSEVMLPRSSTFKETGKRLAVPGALFKEQQLKQLRAQCLVFLAFR